MLGIHVSSFPLIFGRRREGERQPDKQREERARGWREWQWHCRIRSIKRMSYQGKMDQRIHTCKKQHTADEICTEILSWGENWITDAFSSLSHRNPASWICKQFRSVLMINNYMWVNIRVVQRGIYSTGSDGWWWEITFRINVLLTHSKQSLLSKYQWLQLPLRVTSHFQCCLFGHSSLSNTVTNLETIWQWWVKVTLSILPM